MELQQLSCSENSRGPPSVCRPQNYPATDGPLMAHVVLLDINMPRMDGYQACIEMRAIEKSMGARGKSQIIAVTALASEAERRRGLME
jgi:CheY-like chemotaxis protein